MRRGPELGPPGAQGNVPLQGSLILRKHSTGDGETAGFLSQEKLSPTGETLWSLGDGPGFKSQLHYFLAGDPGVSSLTSLHLHCLICKRKATSTTSKALYEDSVQQRTPSMDRSLPCIMCSVRASHLPRALSRG